MGIIDDFYEKDIDEEKSLEAKVIPAVGDIDIVVKLCENIRNTKSKRVRILKGYGVQNKGLSTIYPGIEITPTTLIHYQRYFETQTNHEPVLRWVACALFDEAYVQGHRTFEINNKQSQWFSPNRISLQSREGIELTINGPLHTLNLKDYCNSTFRVNGTIKNLILDSNNYNSDFTFGEVDEFGMDTYSDEQQLVKCTITCESKIALDFFEKHSSQSRFFHTKNGIIEEVHYEHT